MTGTKGCFSRRAAGLVGVVVALAVGLITAPGAMAAPFQDIHSAGPLSDIWISQDLSCQVAHAGNGVGEFFPGGAGPADCGTFLSVTRDTLAPVLFSPQFNSNANGSAAGNLGTAFTPVSQTFTGSGTSASPYTVTTVVTSDAAAGGAVILTETDSYVVGNDFYSTTVKLQNTEDGPTISGVLYHAADCFLRGFDSGFGASLSGTQACTINPSNSPAGALEAFVPSTTANAVETSYPTIWSDVKSNGASLPNGCDCTTQEDNAMGISWTFANLSSTGTTFSWQTKIDDQGFALTGGRSFSGTAPFTVNGALATISDSATSTTASDYTATVNWGDGSSDQNATITGSNGSFSVADNHTYTAPGTYTITVTASYVPNPSISSVATDTANVTAPPVTAPPATVTTGPPTVAGAGTAAFSGSANPDGLPTTVHFDYGLDPKYFGGGPVVYTASTPNQTIGSDFTIHPFSASVSGLVPNALYHVRVVATNSAGTTFGPDVTFATLKTAPPPPPALGKSFNIAPVSGVVLILINGRLVPLTELQQIPQNAVIDALHGTLKLTTAVPGTTGGAHDAAAKRKKHKPKVKTQTGTFGGAIFKINQAGNGLATLSLVEGAIPGGPSYGTCKKHKAGDPTATAAASRTLQLLHASAKGKFTTKGRYGAATVRGTKWTTSDRCDGTLIHDITDSVAVTDFVRHKTIILHAGQSYLAKAHK